MQGLEHRVKEIIGQRPQLVPLRDRTGHNKDDDRDEDVDYDDVDDDEAAAAVDINDNINQEGMAYSKR